MSISKLPNKMATPQAMATAAQDLFISAAPDAPKKLAKAGNKVQISLQLSPQLLERVDAMAAELGQSRAGLISLGLRQLVERGVNVGGAKH